MFKVPFRGDCTLCWYWLNGWPSLFRGGWTFCWYWLNCDHHCLEVLVRFFILVELGPSLLRGDCTFCWYWWNCWSSLCKLSNLLIYTCTYQKNRWFSLTAFAIWYIGAMWCQLWNRNYCGQTQQHIPNMSLTNKQTSFFSV